MKKTLYLLSIVALISCSEDPKPRPVEKFAGSWAYETNELSIYFDVVIHNGIHNVINRRVVSTNIPLREQNNNQIQIFFDDTGKCTAIEVVSRGLTYYYIYMLDNSIGREGIEVSEMDINVPGYEPLTLYNQILRKN